MFQWVEEWLQVFGCASTHRCPTWSSAEDFGPPGHFLRQQLAICPVHGLPSGTGPRPPAAAAPLGSALIGIIACSPQCCDSPVPWQGRPDLQGTYTLLRRIIDLYYHLFTHKPRPLCSQTTAPKVEWRQSSLSAAQTITPFAFFFFFFLSSHMSL